VFDVAGCRLAGTVTTSDPEPLPHDGTWRRAWPVTDDDGHEVSAVWRHDRGDVWLPFDPGAVMHCLWSERYRQLRWTSRLSSALRHLAVRGYYVVRPVLPRQVQLLLRRRLAGSAAAPTFPDWPLHTGLHELYDWLLELVGDLVDAPVPWIAPWPDGTSWCFVLTHDVETAQGLQDLETLRGPERERGYRSAWNFVPERYDTPHEVVQQLEKEGCEVGVHGLRHDGRDLASGRALAKRLPRIREAADRWGATGFRSPATQRSWSLMPRLGFDHDSSYTDTDPYEPQPGGCCSYLPFFIDDLVELPITLPQDHTLFSILGHDDSSLWLGKAHELRRRGGMALVLSHPDYAHGTAARAWRELLDDLHPDPTMWQALPREVASWWRQRAASKLVQDNGQWRVVGPGAGRARVVFAIAEQQGSRA
jgi:peptidoglycan/xylan/chitin deacetylase (PgdA/CDA1 family)